MRPRTSHFLLPLAILIAGCVIQKEKENDNAQQPPAVQPAPLQVAYDTATQVRFVVDISDRQLFVLRGADTLRTTPVAVGTSDHPTPTGEWKIERVDWNPDWTPPPGEDWTEDKEKQPPGAPENPMGRARLVFHPPYTIHGTKERASLGKAESHGSIRVANDVVVELGKLVMSEGGAERPESFFQEVAADRKTMRQVDIPRPIPVVIQQ